MQQLTLNLRYWWSNESMKLWWWWWLKPPVLHDIDDMNIIIFSPSLFGHITCKWYHTQHFYTTTNVKGPILMKLWLAITSNLSRPQSQHTSSASSYSLTWVPLRRSHDTWWRKWRTRDLKQNQRSFLHHISSIYRQMCSSLCFVTSQTPNFFVTSRTAIGN